MQKKWQDWPRFTPSAILFRLTRDPQFPSDTNRVTLQSCCNTLWGYDDIQSLAVHGDVQIHVEFIGMGEYDMPYDLATPNANVGDPFATNTQPGYFNSGVYVQSRYEIQIQSWTTTPGSIPGLHDMGSLVDDFAPTANVNRANGQWQAYDITFRTARYQGTTQTSPAIMSLWWNGQLVHSSRLAKAPATGLSNHSGEEMNATLYGLKLQSEGRDVRFRNVWMKKLRIDSTQTNFGY